jgi:hypothetical protein
MEVTVRPDPPPEAVGAVGRVVGKVYWTLAGSKTKIGVSLVLVGRLISTWGGIQLGEGAELGAALQSLGEWVAGVGVGDAGVRGIAKWVAATKPKG